MQLRLDYQRHYEYVCKRTLQIWVPVLPHLAVWRDISGVVLHYWVEIRRLVRVVEVNAPCAVEEYV